MEGSVSPGTKLSLPVLCAYSPNSTDFSRYKLIDDDWLTVN